jgi:Tfp pilus assembly protein PilF
MERKNTHSKPRRSRPRLSLKRIATVILIILALVGGAAVVYLRVFSAGFVGFDDDIHVYANPFLNPPTLHNLARLWHQSYEQLYVPLAYTIFAVVARFSQVPAHVDSSVGHTVSFDPIAFHVVGVTFHAANVLLCFLLVQRLTRRRTAALLTSLVFALHPLQVESVAWISELRGLSSGFFALLALNALVLSRGVSDEASAKSRALLAASALFATCAMLCKPAAAVLPLLALAIDRIVLGTSWRRAIVASSMWAVCTIPFAWVTSSVQAVAASGKSLGWQRLFIAGDALTFYLFKVFVPIDLCVDYGRTPSLVMSHIWGYLAWAVPVGLVVLCYRNRQRRPITWLGTLMFMMFLLPTLGLVPFAYQGYSTVADRYAYLALIGVGLVVSDAIDYIKPRKIVLGVLSVALVAVAALSFNQSRHWTTSSDFLHHTIAVNPDAAFAYHNLGYAAQANGDYVAAVADYQACLTHDPTRLKAYVNLAQVFFELNQPAEAERAIAQSIRTPGLTVDGMTANDFANLGMVLMQMNQHDRAVDAFSAAAAMDPNSSIHLYNEANALSAVGQFDRAEVAFRRCIALDPTVAGAHTGLGIVLAETHRLAAAADEFRAAARLHPDDPAALDNLKRAESMMEGQGR